VVGCNTVEGGVGALCDLAGEHARHAAVGGVVAEGGGVECKAVALAQVHQLGLEVGAAVVLQLCRSLPLHRGSSR